MARPGISTKNTEKLPPRAEILEAPKIPKEYPQNTEKMHPKWVFFFGILRYSFGIFGGSGISGLGVVFRYFSWKFRVGPCSGLCSRSGHSQREGKRCLERWMSRIARFESRSARFETLSFLSFFWGSSLFFFFFCWEEFLVFFLAVFHSFSGILGVRQGHRKILVFLVGFPCIVPPKQGKKGMASESNCAI